MQCPLEIINLGPSRDVAVLDFSYKFGTDVVFPLNEICGSIKVIPVTLNLILALLQVNVKLRLPAVLNKFLQPISVSAEEFFPQWRSISGPPLKLQEVVCTLGFLFLDSVHVCVCVCVYELHFVPLLLSLL